MFSVSEKQPFRPLTDKETRVLEANGNQCSSWDLIKVHKGFDPDRIFNSSFSGEVKIGEISSSSISTDEIILPAGIYNCMIVSSEIGNNCALHNVGYLSGYSLGDNVIIFNTHEVILSSEPVFGQGVRKTSGNRISIAPVNENGKRRIYPFQSITLADCHLWSRYGYLLDEILTKFTDAEYSEVIKRKPLIGSGSVIRSCRKIYDVVTGTNCRLEGVSRLSSVTIESTAESPVHIGEDSDLENGIIKKGVSVRHGVKAKDFILFEGSKLENGARFFNSCLGENSTIACCEVQNSLINPFHEQHHNNSFLIAAHLQGQSNIAAGATIGSNHNSRSADGEIRAGRGFWAGLCSSIKHSSKFASFTLLSKEDFQHELNIPLPFSLVSLSKKSGELQIMPAYWLMYNMYALNRNTWKFGKRDRRSVKTSPFEYDFLAPDTAGEIMDALEFLEEYNGGIPEKPNVTPEKPLEIPPGIIENSKSPVTVLKPFGAYQVYREMALLYAARELCRYASMKNIALREVMDKFPDSGRIKWINIGGMVIPEHEMEALVSAVENGSIGSWNQVHDYFSGIQERIPKARAEQAAAVLRLLYHDDILDFSSILKSALESIEYIKAGIEISRLKDFNSPFRDLAFDSEPEKEYVMGNLKDDEFIKEAFKRLDNDREIIKRYQ